jgi:hypothetical protein
MQRVDHTGVDHDVVEGDAPNRGVPDNPISRRTGASQVTASPIDLTRFGTRTSALASTVGAVNVDPSLLADDVVGHAGLAQALREFFGTFDQRTLGFRSHLRDLGVSVQQVGARYRDTDDRAANEMDSEAQPDVPKRSGA